MSPHVTLTIMIVLKENKMWVVKMTKIFGYTNYNILVCHVYAVYVLYIYWLKYFDIPTIILEYVVYMLCIYYTYTD